MQWRRDACSSSLKIQAYRGRVPLLESFNGIVALFVNIAKPVDHFLVLLYLGSKHRALFRRTASGQYGFSVPTKLIGIRIRKVSHKNAAEAIVQNRQFRALNQFYQFLYPAIFFVRVLHNHLKKVDWVSEIRISCGGLVAGGEMPEANHALSEHTSILSL